MDSLAMLGQIIFGVYFIFNGVNHLTKMEMMSTYASSKGLPSAKAGVVVSGLLLLVGGLSVLLGYRPQWGIAALVVFLVPTTLLMHAFWKEEEPQAKMMEMVNFMKNMALLGALLMMLAIPEPWPLSVGGQ